MVSIDELDYVEKYREYLPYYISIELENSFEDQLKAKAHLERILDIKLTLSETYTFQVASS